MEGIMVPISYEWLKDFIDLPESPEDVAELLIMLGMEVDSITWYEAPLDRVEVVRVARAVQHPNADRLLLCTVETSRGELPVVCGAPNVREGMKAAWAPPGLILPGGLQVGVAKIRNQESHGMLCSEMELGLTESSEGIIEMDDSHQVGHFVSDYLPATDAIFDLDITINRPDLMSHYGVARDLSAKLQRPLRRPIPDFEESDRPASERIKVSIADPDLGPRYCARAVEGVTVRSSPVKIRQRLERCGVRAISNIVDVTNYVMLEYGHPLHAFDFRFIQGSEIIVRRAKPNEKFVTLDEEEHTLDSEMLVICDAETSVALAGVMGGLNSEIRDDTKDVLIECAYFNPVSIRKTSKKLNMMTESGDNAGGAIASQTCPSYHLHEDPRAGNGDDPRRTGRRRYVRRSRGRKRQDSNGEDSKLAPRFGAGNRSDRGDRTDLGLRSNCAENTGQGKPLLRKRFQRAVCGGNENCVVLTWIHGNIDKCHGVRTTLHRFLAHTGCGQESCHRRIDPPETGFAGRTSRDGKI
jgi:tRNA-binding EMAP/Myf-like protein